MCGIAGIHRLTDRPVERYGRLADELHLGIEERGAFSSGSLALLDSGKVQFQRAVLPARLFVKKRQAFSGEARTLLLHTRHPTVGKVNVVNAQPQIAGRVAAVHNGTIRNATELFETFGLKRRAEVDSEIVPALIDYAGWEQADAALELMRGGAAVAVVNVDRPRELLLARTQTYPLVWMETRDLLLWASTEKAIVRAWQFTYRCPPPKSARWGRLGEWTLLHVNADGQVSLARLQRPKPEPWEVKRSAPKKSVKGKRRAARKHRQGQMAIEVAGKAAEGTRGSTPNLPGLPLRVTRR